MTLSLNFNPFARRKKNNHLAWKIIGGVALAAVAAGLYTTFPEIRRYIKMEMM